MRRLGIECTNRLGPNSRGQVIAYITEEQARRVKDEFRANILDTDGDEPSISEALLAEQGVFYLIALEPDSDPGRFKVGFAGSMPERLRALRCSAPFAKVIATWPCKRLWEKTVIDCVAVDCERLHTEVFRANSLESVRDRCKRFFALMPEIAEPGGAANRSQPGGPETNLPSVAAGFGG